MRYAHYKNDQDVKSVRIAFAIVDRIVVRPRLRGVVFYNRRMSTKGERDGYRELKLGEIPCQISKGCG